MRPGDGRNCSSYSPHPTIPLLSRHVSISVPPQGRRYFHLKRQLSHLTFCSNVKYRPGSRCQPSTDIARERIHTGRSTVLVLGTVLDFVFRYCGVCVCVWRLLPGPPTGIDTADRRYNGSLGRPGFHAGTQAEDERAPEPATVWSVGVAMVMVIVMVIAIGKITHCVRLLGCLPFKIPSLSFSRGPGLDDLDLRRGERALQND